MKIEIIFEDRDILVIYKPAGLATQTAKIGQPDVVSELKNYLREGGQQNPYLGVIHRLDQPVEGLLVFARNQSAAAHLTANLQRQEGLNKHYLAIVCGKPSEKEGELVDYMYKNRDNCAVIVEKEAVQTASREQRDSKTKGDHEAKRAVLKYRTAQGSQVSQNPSCSKLTRLDIEILTGRFHQIRAQMAHAGLPLLGDAKYGNEETKALSRSLGVKNVALCAYKLELTHPTTKQRLTFEVEPKEKAFSWI